MEIDPARNVVVVGRQDELYSRELSATDLNWLAATWGELIFSIMILLGLFTRFAAISLVIVTAVATAAVHWPAGFSCGFAKMMRLLLLVAFNHSETGL